MPLWYESRLWSLPLILATVIPHVFGLRTIRGEGVVLLERWLNIVASELRFALVIGVTVLLVTARCTQLKRVRGAPCISRWAPLPEAKSATLYSSSVMTTYGHASVPFEPHWQMIGRH